MQKLSTAKRRQNREEALTRDTFKEEISRALGMRLLVTPALRESFRKLGVELDDSESATRLSFRRAVIKAVKDGDIKQILMLAEFAGFRIENEQKINVKGVVNQKRNVVINFRRATPEDAK